MKKQLLLDKRRKVKNKTSMQSLEKLRIINGNPKLRDVAINVPCKVSTNIEVARKISGKKILKLV